MNTVVILFVSLQNPAELVEAAQNIGKAFCTQYYDAFDMDRKLLAPLFTVSTRIPKEIGGLRDDETVECMQLPT